MKKAAIILFLAIIVIIGIAVAAQKTYIEYFEDLDLCNTRRTNADWNIVDSLGEPGKICPREMAYTAAGGHPVDATGNDRYIFCSAVNDGGSGGGLYVLNGNITGSPYGLVTSCVTNRNEQGVCIDGRYAYMVSDGGIITRVDCGNLSGALSSSTDNSLAGNDLKAIAAGGGYLYIANATANQLVAMDGLGGATNTVAATDPHDVMMFGPYLLMADGTGGLRVYSLETPDSPVEVAQVATITDCRGLYVSGVHAIIAAGDSLYIVDLSDPTSPSVVNRLGTAGDCYSACENAGFIYAACGQAGTMVFTGPNFTNLWPKCISQNNGGEATGTYPIVHTVAVPDSSGGSVQFLSPSDILSPSAGWTDSTDLTNNPIALEIIGDYAYISVQVDKLATVYLDTMGLVDSDVVGGGCAALGLCHTGNYLLVAAGLCGLRCYSLDDPANPSAAWIQPIGGATVHDVDAVGNYAYVVTSTAPFGIYKVPILGSHIPVASVTLSNHIWGIDVSGEVIYAAVDELGMVSMDLNLTILDTFQYATGKCWGVIAENDYAYVCYSDGGLVTVSLQDPSNLALAGSVSGGSLGKAIAIERYDKYVLIGQDATDQMVAVDVSDQTALSAATSSIGGVSIPEGLCIPEGMQKYRKYMILIDYAAGLRRWMNYPGDCTDSMLVHSYLWSNEISDDGGAFDNFTYIKWKSIEFYPPSTVNPNSVDSLDTITHYFICTEGAVDETIKLFRPQTDPTFAPGTTYYYSPPRLPPNIECWWFPQTGLGNWDDVVWYSDIWDWHGRWHPDSVWWMDTVWVTMATTLSKKRARINITADFGRASDAELVIGLNNSASDRYDPEYDVPYSISGPGPHAYFAVDDPSAPEGVEGLSTYICGQEAGARPVRLILTHPATLTWEIPAELDTGALIIAGQDMAMTNSIDLPAGETTIIPLGGIGLYRQNDLTRGWNMVAPDMIPLSETAEEFFETDESNIWTYDDAEGGFYNTSEIGEGRGYFVLATEPYTYSYRGVHSEWTRTGIHSGWNLIGGPSDGAVHISKFKTEPDSAIWPGPLYTLDDDNGYIATETLEPGKAYWAYALKDGILYADYTAGSRKGIVFDEPDISTQLILTSSGSRTELTLGIDPRASAGIDTRFDRLLPPPAPTMENLGYLATEEAPTSLSADIRPNGNGWTLIVLQNCTAKSEVPLVLSNKDEKVEVNSERMFLASGTYKVTIGEISTPLPQEFELSSKPNPFNARTMIIASIPHRTEAALSIFDITGRKVTDIFDCELEPGGHPYLWDGSDYTGKPMPTGVYFARLSVKDGPVTVAKLVLIK